LCGFSAQIPNPYEISGLKTGAWLHLNEGYGRLAPLRPGSTELALHAHEPR